MAFIWALSRWHVLWSVGWLDAVGLTGLGDIDWTPRSTLVYPAVCISVGLLAGLLGQGGGFIMVRGGATSAAAGLMGSIGVVRMRADAKTLRKGGRDRCQMPAYAKRTDSLCLPGISDWFSCAPNVTVACNCRPVTHPAAHPLFEDKSQGKSVVTHRLPR
jgi:hypothetical protein